MPCVALIALLFIVFPLRYFFLIYPETAVEPVIDYITFEDHFLSTEQPGKQTLLEHSDIAHFFPSHACIRTSTIFCMNSDA